MPPEVSRLWQAQDKTEAAYQRLAEMYHWFSEGFETLDLIEARELQANLAENCLHSPAAVRLASSL